MTDAEKTALANLGTAAAADAEDFAPAGSGAYPVQQVALTGNLAYTLPVGAPTDQVISVVLTQDGVGGHTVTFGGDPLTVDLAPGAATTVEVWPGGRVVYPQRHPLTEHDVRRYGAKGDGSTSDNAAIQAAVDAAYAAGGGTVYLPAGTYQLDAGIKWHPRVSMRGDGVGRSILKQRGTILDAIYNIDGDSFGSGPGPDGALEGCTFEDFEIDGSAMTETQASVSGKGFFILYMVRCVFRRLYIHHTIGTGLGCDFLDDCVIDSVVVSSCGRNFGVGPVQVGQSGIGIGTHWKAVESVTVTNCTVKNNGNYGLFVEVQPTPTNQTIWPEGARFVDCYAEGNRYGFGNKGGGSVVMSGCTAVNNTKANFHTASNNKGDIITGCVSVGSEVGVWIDSVLSDVTVTGCRITGTSQAGIYITQAKWATWDATGITITNNTITKCGWAGIKTYLTTNAVGGLTITGNRLASNGRSLTGFERNGIGLNGPLTDVLITGNWIGNDVGETSQVYGVQVLSGTIDMLRIAGNMAPTRGSHKLYNLYGGTVTNVTVRDNAGAASESSGTGTIWAGNSTATVAHGLPSAPAKVWVTPRGNELIWPSTLGASGVIYSRAGNTGDLPFSWSAAL